MNEILFLAQFAPNMDGKVVNIPKTPEEEFYAETYHRKVFESLRRLGYNFFSTSDVEHLGECHKNYQLVWSLYNRHGFRNCESYVQMLCERHNVKYIGPPPYIRTRIEDKESSKIYAKHVGLNTAEWTTFSRGVSLPGLAPFHGSFFVKPQLGSASIGVDESCICVTWEDACRKINDYFTHGIDDVIAEQFIDGLLYGVPVMLSPEKKLLVATPHYTISNKKGNVVTHSQKRFVEGGMIREVCQDKTLNDKLMCEAVAFFDQILSCDYARVDFIVEKDSGVSYFLEVNTLMNLGIRSGFAASFLHSHNMEYDDIIRNIMELGLSKT